jgi:hypothetical protein
MGAGNWSFKDGGRRRVFQPQCETQDTDAHTGTRVSRVENPERKEALALPQAAQV